MLAFGIAALVNTIYNFSVLSLVGFALVLVAAWWVLAGCARRDEPLARWLLRVDAPST